MSKLIKIAAIVGAGLFFGTVAGKFLKSDRSRTGKISGISNNESPRTGKKKIEDNEEQPEEPENYFI